MPQHSPSHRRLTFGVTGQAFLRLVYAANTIGLVPVLVRGWGLEGYGEWIALTALASYLSYSNFGLVTTAANDMVMAAGADNRLRAARTFQMSANLAFYIVLPLIVVVLGILSLMPVNRALHLKNIGPQAAFAILCLSGMQLWLQTLRGLIAAALYAAGSYGFAYYVAGGCKLLELLGIVAAVALFHCGPVSAASVMTLAAFADLLIIAIRTRRQVSWARYSLGTFDIAWVKRQIRPAIGFAVSNLSTHGVLIQGPRIVLAATLGGPAVAIYTIYGTAMRLVDQFVLMLMLPMEIEIAYATGSEDRRRLSRLIAISTQLCWIIFLMVGVGLIVLGPLIFRHWTRGQIVFSSSLMALYLVMSAANQLGRVSAHALNGTNRMFGPSFLMLGCSAASVLVGAFLVTHLGVIGMVIGGILGEAANSLVVILALSRRLGVSTDRLIRDFLDFNHTLSLLADFFRRFRGRTSHIPRPEEGSP